MSETKKEQEAAFRAGAKVLSVVWPDSIPPEKAVPGPHLNPFGDDRPEQKRAWLEGLAQALEGRVAYDPVSILEEINDEVKVKSDAS